MKRIIARMDPFTQAATAAQGLTEDDYIRLNMIAGAFIKSSRKNLPSINMSLNSFNYDKVRQQLTYVGDMTYEGDNRWLSLKIYTPNGPSQLEMIDLVKAYLREVIKAYGKEVVEEAGLDSLV